MGAPKRISKADITSPVFSALMAQGFEFDMGQAIYLLDCLHPQSVPFGQGDDPRKESFLVSSNVSFGVPSGEISQISMAPQGHIHLKTNMLGIAGVYGPLPPPFAELAMDRGRQKDHVMVDFLDIFNHRMTSLWYRIHRRWRPIDPYHPPEKSNIGKTLLNLGGQWSRHQRFEKALLPFAGLLWQQSRSAVGLEVMLSQYFSLPTQVNQFMGGWLRADESQQSQIGLYESQWNRLGIDALLGHKSWGQEKGIEIVMGRIPWSRFLNLLPGESGFQTLNEMSEYYAGQSYKKRFRFQIAPHEIRLMNLGHSKLYLGYTSWLAGPQKSMASVSAHHVVVNPPQERQIVS